MIRPWYRSRLFWLGLPGLVFMLWLWLAKAGQSFSFGHSAITGPTETTTRSISAGDGSIYQITSRDSIGISPLRGFWFYGSEVDPDEPVTYFPPSSFGIIQAGYWQIWLAWWVVISAYTAVWLGAVAVWQRRKARLSRRAAAELPGA